MILGDQAHIFFYEQGGSAAIGGIHPRTVPNQPDGKIALQDIEAAIRPDNIHFPRTKMILLENTHNRCNGNPLEVDYMQSVGKLARSYELKVHVDGARIFNAAVALGVDASDLVSKADSVSFCLSKGLAAPVGSMVCGTRPFIEKTRRARKVLGGGMRQAGILAAAGIVALTEMVEHLVDDHANAKRLAEGLAGINSISIDPELVKTNIVFFDIKDDSITAEQLAGQLVGEGLKVLPLGPKQLRAVTHYHITPDDIEYALSVFVKVMG